MTNKEIMFISYGVGGAESVNAIYPHIIKYFNNVENITITPFAKLKLKDSKFIEQASILDYIRDKRPDVIINERSNGIQIQNKVTSLCKELGILNICLLDFYGGYDKRFSSIPDVIISPSLSVTKELICFGIKETSIITAGNPAFDRLCGVEYHRKYNVENLKVAFMSQPLDENFYSFTQYDIFKKFLDEINLLNLNYSIDVKVHPNEEPSNWLTLKDEIDKLYVIEFDNTKDFIPEMIKYDLIVGYNSTLMLQSYLMGIPTIYYELKDTKESLNRFKQGESLVQVIKYGDFKINCTESVVNALINIILQS